MSDFDLVPLLQRICRHYPDPDRLSNARLTKTVYMMDWRSAILFGSQITDIEWYFDSYGPWVSDVMNAARSRPDVFEIRNSVTIFGNQKQTIALVGEVPDVDLGPKAESVVSFILENTPAQDWGQFLDTVYQTYPVSTQPRYTNLDLASLAELRRESIASQEL